MPKLRDVLPNSADNLGIGRSELILLAFEYMFFLQQFFNTAFHFLNQIEKVYHAKVAHRLEKKSQIITAPMGPDSTRPMYQVTTSIPEED